MPIVNTLARQGNVTFHPLNGQITYAGSKNFNEAMRQGAAAKIWFQVPKSTGKGDDCFASYDVERGTFNVSREVQTRHNVSELTLQAADNFGRQVREIAVLKNLIDSYPHG
jgi:hypothetical protein